jgi:hypothetical protein
MNLFRGRVAEGPREESEDAARVRARAGESWRREKAREGRRKEEERTCLTLSAAAVWPDLSPQSTALPSKVYFAASVVNPLTATTPVEKVRD